MQQQQQQEQERSFDINNASKEERVEAFLTCCSSLAFAEQLALAKERFESYQDLNNLSRKIWFNLSAEDWEEAFRGHPRIGDDQEKLRERFKDTARWASDEQGHAIATANEQVLKELGEENVRYEKKFGGRIFIICATGVTAEFVLDNIRDRMENSAYAELGCAAREQQKITEIRLRKLNVHFEGVFGNSTVNNESIIGNRVRVLNEQTMNAQKGGNVMIGHVEKKSPITTHVLDTAMGQPAEGIKVTLNGVSSAVDDLTRVGYTNSDGRIVDLMRGDEVLRAGDYELIFHVQEYVRMTTGQKSFYPECIIRFSVFPGKTKENYHVPLLLNPFGFGTYRGS